MCEGGGAENDGIFGPCGKLLGGFSSSGKPEMLRDGWDLLPRCEGEDGVGLGREGMGSVRFGEGEW